MRIAYIAAGAAGMYCGSCLHDNTLAAGLMRRGHEVALIPTYTPLRTDERDVTNESIYYGAINVYLQQKAGLFRRTPAVVDRLLDRPGLLQWVSRFAASTNARDLGALTLSILQAEEGHQQKELLRLLEFLESYKPDIVQLTNGMFLGIGAAIRTHLGVPVVGGLTGEDLFLEELPPPFHQQVAAEMSRHAKEVEGLIATSRYYAKAMTGFLDVDEDRMHVVPLGINFEDFPPRDPVAADKDLTIGYLARICPEKGLHLLVDAFHLLRQQAGQARIRLKIAGYLGARDIDYLEEQKQKLAAWGLSDAVDILGEIDRQQKIEFLRSIDVLSVPTIYKEPKGLFVLEGWAASAPAVLPRHGAFPELIDETGAGLLVEPESPEDLARGLTTMIETPEWRIECGMKGRQAVETKFNTQMMTLRTEKVYQTIMDAHHSRQTPGAKV